MNRDKSPIPLTDDDPKNDTSSGSKEDIYNQDERVSMDEEGNIINKRKSEINEAEEDLIGADLDIPGADLDDENEIIGEEDEENNYYSLGNDNHDDSEEVDR